MQCLKLIFTALVVVGLTVAGCSKKESETPTPPSTPAHVEKAEPPAPTPPAPTPPSEPGTTTSSAPLPVPAPVPPPATLPAEPEETPAQLAAQVQQLESTYHNTPDFQKRVELIYDLSSVESPATIEAMSHLFANEPDPELKVELINSLSDIDGENDKKLTILTSALRPDQPKDVRSEAIDAIVDTEDKRGVQILQGLLHDPDEDIRESAQDGIEQLQATVTNPQ